MQALERVHSDFLLLGQAVGRLPAELYIQPGALAMSSYLSLLFSTVARVRPGEWSCQRPCQCLAAVDEQQVPTFKGFRKASGNSPRN